MKKVLVLIFAILFGANMSSALDLKSLSNLIQEKKEYFENSNIVEKKYKLINGEIEGKVSTYNINGKLISKERYKEGVKQGYSYFYEPNKRIKKYYENDTLLFEKVYENKIYTTKNTFENDVLSNKQEFLKDGRVFKETEYKNKNIEKVIRTYFKDIDGDNSLFFLDKEILPTESSEIASHTTVITNEIFYSNNSPKTNHISYFDKNKTLLWKLKCKGEKLTNSIVYIYDEKGNLDSVVDTNIIKESKKITTYHPNKTVKTIQEYSKNPITKEFDIADGDFYTYKENGKIISKIIYKNNKIVKNELWEYYPTGELFIKATNKNNQEKGKYLEYAQNGILVVDENYLENKPDGVKKEYFKNGNIKFVGYYKKGLPSGKSTSYWKNGNLSNETFYLEGKKHGVSKSYWENGNIAFYDTYSYGTLKSKKAYDMYGKELWAQKY